MRFFPAALMAVLTLASAPVRADTALPPGESGVDIAGCVDAAKRSDADATILLCSRALDAGHLGDAPTVAALVNRGLARIAKNEPAAAIPDFDRALALRPETVAFYDMRATAHAMQGDLAPALRDYAEVVRRAVPEEAGPSERTLREGIALHLGGDDAAASRLFDQALRLAEEGSDDQLRALLWQNLALQAGRRNALGRLDAAIAGQDLTTWPGPLILYHQNRITEVAMEQALEDPDPAISTARACQAAFFVAARALADGRFGVAKDGFGHAQTLCAPDSIERVAARAEALVAAQPIAPDLSNDMLQCQAADANGETALVVEHCSRALAHAGAPDAWRVGALTRRATAYHGGGALEPAIADLDAALALRPDSVDLYRQRSSYRLEKGESSGGLADLAYALTLQPAFVPGYVDRAWVKVSAGDTAGAFGDFSKALAIEPGQPRLHLGRGVVAYLGGDDAQAAADFAAVIQASPRAPYAVLWLVLTDKRTPLADRAALENGVAALDLGQWPGPLVAFVRGEISAADLAAAATDPDPAAAGKRGCETAFYSAVSARISGDEPAARDGFREALGACSPDNIEYHAAKAVLTAP